jgi:branched-chain amino acid transport system substrate-binding protein
VTPQTGALAAFGEADKFVVDQMNGYFNDHPIQAGGKSYTVDIVVKDTSPIPVGPAK